MSSVCFRGGGGGGGGGGKVLVPLIDLMKLLASRLRHQWHDDVIKWKHFPRYWPFVRRIHRSLGNSPHKGQWRGALMFSLICVWINGWVNNRGAGDLRRNQTHYDVIVMELRLEAITGYCNRPQNTLYVHFATLSDHYIKGICNGFDFLHYLIIPQKDVYELIPLENIALHLDSDIFWLYVIFPGLRPEHISIEPQLIILDNSR